MSSAREMRMRIRSVKNIAQVTKAMEAVSASKVRKAIAAVQMTRPYATKAWQVLTHIAGQPGREALHPLLVNRKEVKNRLVVLISGDRGLAGAYNTNLIRFAAHKFDDSPVPVSYVAVGRKGRDLMLRRRKKVIADFSNLPAAPTFAEISPIGRLAVNDFLEGKVDEVCLVYTRFINMVHQEPVAMKLLPLDVAEGSARVVQTQHNHLSATYIYEPAESEILDQIVSRFTALQVYQAVLEAQASEYAARMVAMRNATDNALELVEDLQLVYNKARQQSITNDLLDIAGGAEALAQAIKQR